MGSQVTVSYQADNPEQSLLEPGLHAQVWIKPGVGVVISVVGGLMLLFLPRILVKPEAANESAASADKTSA